MKTKDCVRFLWGLAVFLGLQTNAWAQSTDGYHSIQIFPVVADTASFTQQFVFRNPNSSSALIEPRYLPGEGTAQLSVGPLSCPTFSIPPFQEVIFNTLREMCPALVAGSAFGFLYTAEINADNRPYSGYSRVSNAQGNGFSVEAFPAHTFTSARSVVTGIRRLAATPTSPAFQTNCFMAVVNEITATVPPVTTTIEYIIATDKNVELARGSVVLTSGRLIRLLDIFASAGLPLGDYNNAKITFSENGVGEPAIMSFCTVQDNTSFGADFRIAKQQANDAGVVPNPHDDHVQRISEVGTDILGRTFGIDTGANANTHVAYFRHPDRVQCELIDPQTNARALAAYGLEMRLLDAAGNTVAGGDDAVAFSEVYLGDKSDRNNGANGRYIIEVESNGNNAAAGRSYRLRCQSGSGHNSMDIIRYKDLIDRF